MPVVLQDTLWRSAHLVYVPGGRYTIGWQDARKEGPSFVVARTSIMGGEKILERFPLTEDGWVRAWAGLVKLDAGAAEAVAGELESPAYANQAAEAERRAKMRVFGALAVEVQTEAGEVWALGGYDLRGRWNTSRLLGPLAGSQAVVTDGSQAWSPGRAMFLPVSLTGLATKTKADAVVIFADGTFRTVALDGNNAVREAQKQAVQFNALAGASAPVARERGSDPAAKLRKLQELRDAGLLTQDEYEKKRAEVIDSI